MRMTPEEICRDYRQAKKPKQQIKILSELNQCTSEEITAILQAAGELKEAPAKENKAEIEKCLIELYQQGYSNADIAAKKGLSKHQVSIRLTWLKKKGHIVDDNMAYAEPENVVCSNVAKPPAIYTINRMMSLLSTMTSIPQTQILSLSMRFTDDGGKNWRLDLRYESGENTL